MVYCSVPGCEKNNKHQRKRFMFSFPKKEDLLQKWLEAIPNLGRPIKSSWRVCQHHFEKKDILQDFSHTIGGEMYVIERERPRLKPNAVPTKNLHSEKFPQNEQNIKMKNTYLKVASNSTDIDIADGGAHKDRNHINDKTQITENCIEKPHIIKVIDTVLHNNKKANLPTQPETAKEIHKNVEYVREYNEQINRPNFENFEAEKSKSNSNGTDKAGVLERSPSKESLNENKIAYPPQCSNTPTPTDPESFENLFDNVFEIVLPTTLWGVHRSTQQNRIMFVSIEEELLNINKMITVNDKGELKIYLAERVIREEQWPLSILTTEHISNMLAELESMQICPGARFSESCEVYLADNDHNNEQKPAFCKKCY
uniref:THAP-type domain-containing protein n=1 Tax=Ceratitis capitata TaxID=7213 RepID=W8C6B4_CERCA